MLIDSTIKSIMPSLKKGVFFSFLVLLLCGCDNSIEIQSALVDFDGIELSSSDNGLHNSAIISESKKSFMISANRILTRVKINGVVCVDINGAPESEGYWGSINVSQRDGLYLYQIQINPNNSSKYRVFQFKIGSGETYSIINIKQEYKSSTQTLPFPAQAIYPIR